MKKAIKIILAVVIALFVAMFLFKDAIIKTVVTVGASKVLGVPVHIDSFSLGILKPGIKIIGLKVYNPGGFKGKVPVLDMPEITVNYSLSELLKKKLHLYLVVVNLKQMSLVRNQESSLNVDVLQEKVKRPGSQAMPIQIDLMRLTIDKLVYADYSQAKPLVKVYSVGLKDKEFKNINSVQQLVTSVLIEGMKPTAIKSAALYGAASVLGMGFIPPVAANLLLEQVTDNAEFKAGYSRVYKAAEKVLRVSGEIIQEDSAGGVLVGKVAQYDVNVSLYRKSDNQTEVRVSAKEHFLAKPEVAEGILYQISQELLSHR